jgi:hypothetical protein
MISKRFIVCAIFAIGIIAGCSSTRTIQVPVDPRVDLSQYNSVGLVMFTSNGADEQTCRLATQQFLEAVQAAQPGTRVVELGTESQVLASVDRKRFDVKSLQAILETHGVDAVIMGRFDMQRSKPDISLSTMLKTMSVSSDVEGMLSAKIIETESGATMWSDSSKMTVNVGGAQFDSKGRGEFGVTDPEAVYGEMIGCLVDEITDDFCVHYITKRVPKDTPQTASAE